MYRTTSRGLNLHDTSPPLGFIAVCTTRLHVCYIIAHLANLQQIGSHQDTCCRHDILSTAFWGWWESLNKHVKCKLLFGSININSSKCHMAVKKTYVSYCIEVEEVLWFVIWRQSPCFGDRLILNAGFLYLFHLMHEHMASQIKLSRNIKRMGRRNIWTQNTR